MGLLAVETGIRAALVADAGVSALVSTRVHVGSAPKPVFPLLTVEMDDDDGHSNMTGAGTLEESRVVVAVYSYALATTLALYRAVKEALGGYVGVVTVGADSVTFDAVFLAGMKDAKLDVTTPDGGTRVLYCREVTFQVFSLNE